MYIKRLSKEDKSGLANYILGPAFKILSIVMIVLLFSLTSSLAQKPMVPTETLIKPTGTAETDISIWLPAYSVTQAFTPRADFIAEQDLPENISYPPYTVGQAFTFGLWAGASETISRFSPSIVINKKYEDSDLDIFPDDRPDEETLHLIMYDPVTQSWIKLCSSVDVHENVVSAALSFPTPLDGKGSSLMALALDTTPPAHQVVDNQGNTAFSLRGSSLGFQVLVATVDPGSHFAITILPSVPDSGEVTLFSRPVDIKGCQMDHTNPTHENRQLTVYPKPLKVGFSYDSDTLSRVGSESNLTIVNNQNGIWVDEEALGFRVVRSDDTITVDTVNTGTFGLAAR